MSPATMLSPFCVPQLYLDSAFAPTAISRITLDTTPDTSGWTKDLINYNFIKVVLTINGCTGGKLNLLMVMK